MCGFYRKHVPHFAQTAKPLTELTRKESKFIWSIDCDRAFGKLKSRLVNAPILVAVREEEPFILTTDASNNCTAGVREQIQPDGT